MCRHTCKIVLATVFVTVTIGLMGYWFYLVLDQKCELTYLNPDDLAEQSDSIWFDRNPIQSTDSKLMLRMSAYFEYDIDHEEDSIESIDRSAQWGSYLGNSNSTTSNNNSSTTVSNSTWPAISNSSLTTTQRPPILPSIFSTPFGKAFLQQQQQQLLLQQQSTSVAANNASSSNTTLSQSSLNGTSTLPTSRAELNETKSVKRKRETEERYIMLQLRKLAAKTTKSDSMIRRYLLKFACAAMMLTMVHKEEMVFVQSINVHLNLANKNRKTCDIQLPDERAFAVQYQPSTGLAHYYCDKSHLMKFKCYHRTKEEKKANQWFKIPERLLAEITFGKLEYETFSNVTAKSFRLPKLNFQSPISEC